MDNKKNPTTSITKELPTSKEICLALQNSRFDWKCSSCEEDFSQIDAARGQLFFFPKQQG